MRHRRAVDEDLAAVGSMRTGEHAHEGRLPGAVAAHETDDLAGVQVDRHVAHGMDAAEGDVDVAHLHERDALGDGHVALTIRRRGGDCRCRSRPPTTRTMPATTFWVGEFTPMNASPYASDCITKAPRTAPGMVPMPPAKDVPPTTAAAMT